MSDPTATAAASVDWERIAREAVLHVIRHREDFHNASHRPCGTCDRSAAFLANLPDDVTRGYVDSSCTSMNTPTAPCAATYGILVCQRDHGTLRSVLPHRATLGSGERVTWGNDCNEICTADCGWCKGALRRARMLADIDAADEDD